MGAGLRKRAGERGAAGPLGLLAVFVAAAMVLTVIMLFVTGVAQRGILPRVRARAIGAAHEVPAEAVAPGPTTGAGPAAGTALADGAPAAPALSQAQLDSLGALKDQIRVGRESLDERIRSAQQEAERLERERSGADEEAQKRIKALAKVYSSMKAEAAARVMANLDDETFTRVLESLERRQAAKILGYIDPARVARLTQEAATSVADRDD